MSVERATNEACLFRDTSHSEALCIGSSTVSVSYGAWERARAWSDTATVAPKPSSREGIPAAADDPAAVDNPNLRDVDVEAARVDPDDAEDASKFPTVLLDDALEAPTDPKAPPADALEAPNDPKAPPVDPEEAPADAKAPPVDAEENPNDPKAPPVDPEEAPNDPKPPEAAGLAAVPPKLNPPVAMAPLLHKANPAVRADRQPAMACKESRAHATGNSQY